MGCVEQTGQSRSRFQVECVVIRRWTSVSLVWSGTQKSSFFCDLHSTAPKSHGPSETLLCCYFCPHLTMLFTNRFRDHTDLKLFLVDKNPVMFRVFCVALHDIPETLEFLWNYNSNRQ